MIIFILDLVEAAFEHLEEDVHRHFVAEDAVPIRTSTLVADRIPTEGLRIVEIRTETRHIVAVMILTDLVAAAEIDTVVKSNV